MCNYQKLYCSNQGYIVRCTSCQSYHVAFHTSLITLSENHFRYLTKILEEHLQLLQDEVNGNVKNIYLPLPADGFGLTLTVAEASYLLKMLHHADAESKTQTLLYSMGIFSERTNE